jgi:hypothetical protein
MKGNINNFGVGITLFCYYMLSSIQRLVANNRVIFHILISLKTWTIPLVSAATIRTEEEEEATSNDVNCLPLEVVKVKSGDNRQCASC